ncbi:transposase [Streptococcus pneumoniae]|nr:transposase [Streptococcus pneumoniae]
MTEFSLVLLLKSIKLARWTYYYHLKQLDKTDKDQELKAEIQSIFIEHKGNYAYRFYRPTFRMHLTNKEILNKLLSYSEDLKHHYQLYQLLLFHFQNKEPEKFFGLIEDNLKQVHPIFQTVFKTFLKDKEKIVNALQLHYSNAKLEATNNLIKLIKRNAFGFRNFENFKKRIFIALNIKKERTKFVLSQA